MSGFYERFFVRGFCYVLPFVCLHGAELTLVWLNGATTLQDSRCSNLLAQRMPSPPLIRAGFSEAMDHTPLPEGHKTEVPAIRTYAETLFPAPYLIGLLFELGAHLSGFLVLSEYTTRRGSAYTARIGVPFHGPARCRSHGFAWELRFLHWEEKGWVMLHCSRRKLECIPHWESIWGGGV